ncbi:MAG: polysaccharide biosynthesis C-terminal domain-containing protein, partial [Chloroflexi bacterium]|nr:polysaccharide biosynthesis C-terminal domain-containing protein [Chloroflexota bacterium]
LAIQAAGLPAQGMRWTGWPALRHPGVREVARLTGPRILGLAAMHGNFVVLTVLASTLAAGSLGALTYGWSVMMAPMGIFGMALATALFPALAEMAAQNRHDDLRESIAAGVRYLLFLNIPAGVGMMTLAGPLVRLLFERGQFTPEASAATAAAVASFGTGLFAYAAIEVITRGYYALRDTVTPLWYGGLALALNLAFGLLLMGQLGVAGLALGMALSTAIEFFGMYETLRRRLNGLHTAAMLRSTASTVAATAVMAAAVLGWRAALNDGTTPLGLLTVVAGGVIIGAATFLATALACGSPEARQIAARVGKSRSLFINRQPADTGESRPASSQEEPLGPHAPHSGAH